MFQVQGVDALCRAIDEYAAVSHRGYEHAVNKALRDVAARAVANTHHADKTKLRQELSDPGTARARFIRRRKQAGLPIPPKAAMAAAVRTFVANTLRSVNFMRAGWLPGIRKLNALVRDSNSDRDNLGGKSGFGGVVTAHAVGAAIEGEMFNASISVKSPTSAWALDHYATPALNAAILDKTADMQVYITRKHDEAAARFNA